MSLKIDIALAKRLFRMSALRQAVLLSLIFLAVLLGTGLIAQDHMRRAFDRRVEVELESRFQAIASQIAQSGFDHQRYQLNWRETVALKNAQGVITGDATKRLFRRTGYFTEDESRHRKTGRLGRRHRGDDWLYLVRPIDGGTLLVGTDLGRRRVFLEVISDSFIWVGLIAGFLALSVGAALGFRAQNRMNRMSGVLEKISTGDLSARINTPRNRDDLDGLANRIDETNEQLEILVRQTRDFSKNIAHDLKTPLARLRIRLEEALIAENEGKDSGDQLESALEQTDRIISIFEAFLRIAKLESGVAREKFSPVDLGTLAEDIASTYQAVVEDTGRTFETRIENPATVNGDRVLLFQMIANLIENSIRHTPEETKITLVAKGISFGVADTGPGVPDHEYENITKPLYRLEKSRTTEGAGLGLALIKTIAQLHEADLKISANPDLKTSGLYVRSQFTNL